MFYRNIELIEVGGGGGRGADILNQNPVKNLEVIGVFNFIFTLFIFLPFPLQLWDGSHFCSQTGSGFA